MGPIFGLKYLDNQQGVTTFDIVMSFHILPLLILHLRTFIILVGFSSSIKRHNGHRKWRILTPVLATTNAAAVTAARRRRFASKIHIGA